MRLGDLDELREAIIAIAGELADQRAYAATYGTHRAVKAIDAAPTVSCEECEHEGWCEQSVTMYDPGRRKQAGMMARETRMGLDACSRFQRRSSDH